MKKILHISNWYPNSWNKLEGLFVKEQFNVFSEVSKSYLVNVQIRDVENGKLFEFKHIKYSDYEEGYYILTSIKSDKMKEMLTTILLLIVLYKKRYKKFDILHFHIAYPLLIHLKRWKKFIKKPIILSEHWSAYHYNFYMPKNSNKINGIKKIFWNNFKLITVSKALLEDIKEFSANKLLKSIIIPNVVDSKIFYCKDNSKQSVPTFFMVNNWRKIKNPFPILKAFSILNREKIDFKLYIGGYGELLEDMKKYILDNGYIHKVIFFGKMDKLDIANIHNKSDAFLFSSKYETFSVVCAEAVCCGSIIIGPKIKAIAEYADDEMYIKVSKNEQEEWANTLKDFIKNKFLIYNKNSISRKANRNLSTEIIKRKYIEVINEYI